MLMESEHTRLKYEREGYVLYRLNDHDAVAKAGVCVYCGAKDSDHFEGCALWCPA